MVNFGDRVRVRGDEQASLAWVRLEESHPFTVYVTARIDGPPALVDNVMAIATIEWGHGGASVTQEYPIIRRLRVPLAASMVRVSARLVADPPATPLADMSAELAAVVAPGVDGGRDRNTRWARQHGSAGVLSSEPQRVVALDGYNALATPRWIMLFDARAVPPDGTLPDLARPAPPYPNVFELGADDARPFHAGVSWAVSSTPVLLTRDAAADVRIDVGFLL